MCMYKPLIESIYSIEATFVASFYPSTQLLVRLKTVSGLLSWCPPCTPRNCPGTPFKVWPVGPAFMLARMLFAVVRKG